MPKSFAFWNRKLHRYASIVIALPLLIVIGSGMLLMLKKEADWIQPPTLRGEKGDPSISFGQILEQAAAADGAGISGWDDVDRLDVRPSRSLVKVKAHSGMEVQIDTTTGEVLQVMRRRSDLIESIHDGSWFHEKAKLWFFLPCAAVLLFLWFSGLYVWLQPKLKRRG
ncbi:MAG: PepSY-associated TM helix domain-containing protein [Planctomycetota bacterium]